MKVCYFVGLSMCGEDDVFWLVFVFFGCGKLRLGLAGIGEFGLFAEFDGIITRFGCT